MKMLIGGTWQAAANGRTEDVTSPFDGTVTGTVPVAGPDDVRAAVDRAETGAVTWRRTPAHERMRILLRAAELAEELGEPLGRSVGYKIRFQDTTPEEGYVKVMTDGILLAEAVGDRMLSAYDTLIVDEAHERNLNIDFILGFLRMLVHRRRDLRVVVTSATIDTAKFSRAFDNAPVIEVSGRTYPVEVRYEPPEGGPAENEATPVEQAVAAVRRLRRERRAGDTLVFMPTEQDIRETCEAIAADAPPGTPVLPLFARLTAAEQGRVFRPAPAGVARVIVATNVAETSITIPGITTVVDTGLARIPRYSPRTRTTAMPVVPISRSSADQRKGRCGRTAAGLCIRLYSEEDYLAGPSSPPPRSCAPTWPRSSCAWSRSTSATRRSSPSSTGPSPGASPTGSGCWSNSGPSPSGRTTARPAGGGAGRPGSSSPRPGA